MNSRPFITVFFRIIKFSYFPLNCVKLTLRKINEVFTMNYVLILLIALLSIIFLLEMRHSMRRSNANSRLIEKYRDDLQNKELPAEIYAFCRQDYKLRRIVKKHDLTLEDIEKIYQKLLIWGNFHKGRRFVPITAFLYVCTLDYLCQHKDGDAKELTMKCMNFLHI